MKNKIVWHHRIEDEFFDPDEPVKRYAPKKNPDRLFRMKSGNDRVMFDQYSFKCLQCNTFVKADKYYSGVNNRNHCPICLWSRHMDLNVPGDRKSDCQSRMQPIGLTMKQTHKRYGQNNFGELMLVHKCTGCGKYSINRVAADDEALVVFQIYRESSGNIGSFGEFFHTGEIVLLTEYDSELVMAQLFGRTESNGFAIVETV